jgi:hypothetical protein
MKNLIGAILGVLIGGTLLVFVLGASDPGYMAPYDTIWFLFYGSHLLATSFNGLLQLATLPAYAIAWIVIGAVSSIFSQKGWNTVRTAVWIGIIQGVFALGHILLTDSSFWGGPNRNLSLIILFASSVLVALLIMPTAYPLTVLKERLLLEADEPVPEKIESTCVCGAVFKSNPLICSECGRTLRSEPTTGRE